jgi:hypothetical protein
MKHKIKVVMLPTENGILQKAPNGLPYIVTEHNRGISDHIPQHIYITLSQDVEPIKKGDWKYCSNTDKVLQFHGTKNCVCKDCRKIISTTDTSLKIFSRNMSTLPSLSISQVNLPQLQQSFLKEFVANPDGEFEVEYDDIGLTHREGSMVDGSLKIIETLKIKLNQDNTVNIISVEEKMYSREELDSAVYSALTTDGKGAYEMAWSHEDATNWIKKNIKKK